MKLDTKYHGVINYKEENIITFNKGIPGFENLREFILFPVEDNEIFSILHSIEDNEIGIILVSPFYVMKDYEFKLSDEKIVDLNIENPEDVLVYSTVTLNSDMKNTTTNLKAPIIVNIKEKLGEQLIVDKEIYKLKHPLFNDILEVK